MLQLKPCSEVELETFYNQFGPSARSAYTHASSPDLYEGPMLEAIANVTFKEVDTVLRQATGLHLSSEISHRLLLICPGASRNTFHAVIPTRYLYEKLRDALVNRSLEAGARLYSMFLRYPKTRTAAAYMLDDAIHDLFYKGGEWPVVRLTPNRPGPKFTHWKTPEAKTNPEYLRIGYQGRPITIAPDQLSNNVKCDALPLTAFLHGAKLTLVDGYYCPSCITEETLDAFIYDAASKTATIFQATVWPKYSIKERGICWLQGLGVQKFRYVAVTPPDQKMDLPFPNAWNNARGPSLPDKYVLIVKDYPILGSASRI